MAKTLLNKKDLRESKSARQKRVLILIIIVLALGVSTWAAFHLSGDSEADVVQSVEQPAVLPAEWLIRYFGTDDEYGELIGGPSGDPDRDILTNFQEFYFGTDPTNEDTDGDGQIDGAEIAFNQNPLGEGQLYATELSQDIADRFLTDNNLGQYTAENIKRKIDQLINLPDPEDLVIPLPDSSELTISTDDSPEAVDRYLSEIDQLSLELNLTREGLINALETNSYLNKQVLIGSIYEMINRMRELEVPVPFLNLHQLQIAGLFSSAHILEVGLTIDETAPYEEQSEKVQKQFAELALIEKIDGLVDEEINRQKVKYGEQIEKYSNL